MDRADPHAPQDPDPAFAVRRLMRGRRKAALGTVGEGGRPHVSLVTVGFDVDAGPILLLSRLADHSRNIDRDARVALLFDATDGLANPQQGPRVTLEGRIRRDPEGRLARRFLARHPKAGLYAGFGDFAFFRVLGERAHWVGGFGKARWFDRGLTSEPSLAAALAGAEEELLARLEGRRCGGWRVVAIDPDGCDLVSRGRFVRRDFAAVPGSLEEIFDQVAELTTKV